MIRGGLTQQELDRYGKDPNSEWAKQLKASILVSRIASSVKQEYEKIFPPPKPKPTPLTDAERNSALKELQQRVKNNPPLTDAERNGALQELRKRVQEEQRNKINRSQSSSSSVDKPK